MLWAAWMACADGAPTPAAGKAKEPAPNSSASCLECHSDPKLTMKKAGQVRPLFVNEAAFAKSVHRTLDCTDCHEGFDAESIPHQKPISAVDCGSCHEKEGKQYGASIHGMSHTMGGVGDRRASCRERV